MSDIRFVEQSNAWRFVDEQIEYSLVWCVDQPFSDGEQIAEPPGWGLVVRAMTNGRHWFCDLGVHAASRHDIPARGQAMTRAVEYVENMRQQRVISAAETVVARSSLDIEHND